MPKVAEFTHTIPSGSRIVVVVSTGPLDDAHRQEMEDNDIRMLDVMGKSQGVALEELAEIGLKPRVIYDYSDAVAKGAVMAQHPAADVVISLELESLLLVSSGPSINERVQVNLPDVRGKEAEEAATKLRDAGLSPQIVHYKSSSVQKGKVSAQIPNTDSLVAQPEVKSKVAWIAIAVIVAVLLGLGYFIFERTNIVPPPPVEQVVSHVVVPNLLGLDEEGARLELQKLGLTLGQVTTAYAEDTPQGAAPGTVIGSIPAEGEEVIEGSPISIVLAGEAPGDALGMTLVPDVLGLDEEEALAIFEEFNLTANIIQSPNLEVREGYVLMQSPIGHTEVAEESIVVVVISTGEPLEPEELELADVTGLPVADATEKLQEAGLVVTLPLRGGGNETVLGAVVKQMPEAGEIVLLGSVVILEVETQQ
ncbi:MAG: PASTA domain-containing protein [Coriobacteriia bacterium]|nr:PASTA domain-containing protein [Coriobacteriia bacterium]